MRIENLGCAIIMQFLEVFNKSKIGDEKMLDKRGWGRGVAVPPTPSLILVE